MWFKKALTLAPSDPSVRDQFGKNQLKFNEKLYRAISIMWNINQ